MDKDHPNAEKDYSDRKMPLSRQGRDDGLVMAKELRDYLEAYPNGPVTVKSSPFLRTEENAGQVEHTLSGMMHGKVKFDERLGEIKKGKFWGLSQSERKKKYPDAAAEFSRMRQQGNGYEARFLGGESLKAVYDNRTEPFVKEHKRKFPDGDLVIISHDNTLRLLLAAIKGKDPRKFIESEPLPNCGSIRLLEGESWDTLVDKGYWVLYGKPPPISPEHPGDFTRPQPKFTGGWRAGSNKDGPPADEQANVSTDVPTDLAYARCKVNEIQEINRAIGRIQSTRKNPAGFPGERLRSIHAAMREPRRDLYIACLRAVALNLRLNSLDDIKRGGEIYAHAYPMYKTLLEKGYSKQEKVIPSFEQQIKDADIELLKSWDEIEKFVSTLSFEFRVGKLYDEAVSKLESPADKAAAKDAFDTVLGRLEVEKLPDKGIDNKVDFLNSMRKVEKKLASGYPNEENEFAAFLKEVQQGLPNGHPLKTYMSLDHFTGEVPPVHHYDTDWKKHATECYARVKEKMKTPVGPHSEIKLYRPSEGVTPCDIVALWCKRKEESALYRQKAEEMIDDYMWLHYPPSTRLEIPAPKDRKTILITGGIGSGKTTLMGLLTKKRLTQEEIDNLVFLNADYLKPALALCARDEKKLRVGLSDKKVGDRVHNESSAAIYELMETLVSRTKAGEAVPNVILSKMIVNDLDLQEALAGGGLCEIHQIAISPKNAVTASKNKAHNTADPEAIHNSVWESSHNLLKLAAEKNKGKKIVVYLYCRDSPKGEITYTGVLDMRTNELFIENLEAFKHLAQGAQMDRDSKAPLSDTPMAQTARQKAYINQLLDMGITVHLTDKRDRRYPVRCSLIPYSALTTVEDKKFCRGPAAGDGGRLFEIHSVRYPMPEDVKFLSDLASRHKAGEVYYRPLPNDLNARVEQSR